MFMVPNVALEDQVQWPRVGRTGSNCPLLLVDKTGSVTADDGERRPKPNSTKLYSLRTLGWPWPSDPLTQREKAGSRRLQTKTNLQRVESSRPELQTKSYAVNDNLSHEAHTNSDKMIEAVTKVLIQSVIIVRAVRRIPVKHLVSIFFLTQIPVVVAETVQADSSETPSVYQLLLLMVGVYLSYLISERIAKLLDDWTKEDDADSSDDEDDSDEEDDEKTFETFSRSEQYSNIMEEIADSLRLGNHQSESEDLGMEVIATGHRVSAPSQCPPSVPQHFLKLFRYRVCILLLNII